jgi:signal peptidase II
MVLVWSILGSLTLSLIAMGAARAWLTHLPIIGSYVSLDLSANRGIAFSMRLPPVVQEITILAALIIVCIAAFRARERTLPQNIGFGCMIGGAICNLIDRMLHGAVTDFISVGTFPIFNLADTAICIGAGLLVLDALAQRKKPHAH